MSRSCVSARVRARVCPRARLAVRAEPAALTPGRRRAQPMVWAPLGEAPAPANRGAGRPPRRATRGPGVRAGGGAEGGCAGVRVHGRVGGSARVSRCAWVLVGARVRARALGPGSAGGAGGSGRCWVEDRAGRSAEEEGRRRRRSGARDDVSTERAQARAGEGPGTRLQEERRARTREQARGGEGSDRDREVGKQRRGWVLLTRCRL